MKAAYRVPSGATASQGSQPPPESGSATGAGVAVAAVGGAGKTDAVAAVASLELLVYVVRVGSTASEMSPVPGQPTLTSLMGRTWRGTSRHSLTA